MRWLEVSLDRPPMTRRSFLALKFTIVGATVAFLFLSYAVSTFGEGWNATVRNGLRILFAVLAFGIGMDLPLVFEPYPKYLQRRTARLDTSDRDKSRGDRDPHDTTETD